MQWQKLPYYIFFIIRPDGNAAYSRINQNYPLDIQTDQLLGIISLVSALNNLQTGITHPDIINNRQYQLNLHHMNSIKSINTDKFQLRTLDSINGYRFVFMANNLVDSKKIDGKLEEIYKCFVNYVIKAPFFNKDQKIQSHLFKKKSTEILET